MRALDRLVDAAESTPSSIVQPKALATLNHIRWPDGVADGSGIAREVEMLGGLGDPPLQ